VFPSPISLVSLLDPSAKAQTILKDEILRLTATSLYERGDVMFKNVVKSCSMPYATSWTNIFPSSNPALNMSPLEFSAAHCHQFGILFSIRVALVRIVLLLVVVVS
jgi:hypothetical protein